MRGKSYKSAEFTEGNTLCTQLIHMKTGVPSDLFGEISILLGKLPCWQFHRTEQI